MLWNLLFSLFGIPWVNPFFYVGYSFGVERLYGEKRLEISLESETFVHLLVGVEG